MTARPEDHVLAWLLEKEEPSIRYLASRDLIVPRPSGRTLRDLRAKVTEGGWAKSILSRQKEKTWWATDKTCYGPKFKSTIWQLQVLADLGASRKNERISNAVEFWFSLHHARDGGYCPGLSRSKGHLCTTGNMARSLIRLGYLKDERVESAIEWLVDRQEKDGGWDCFGRQRGTIDGWEAMSALAEVPQDRRSGDVRNAIEAGAEFFLARKLLHEGRPYAQWYMLRYPWHYYYDVLAGLDFMTALGYGGDPRMREALSHLKSKRLADGRWALDGSNGDLRLETSHRPSKMVTFLALRVLKRVRDSA